MRNGPIALSLRPILFGLLLLFEELAQRIEALVPEAFVLRGPSCDLAQWRGAQAEVMLAPLPRAPYQAGPLQHLDVLGHRVERHRERLRQVGDADMPARQPRHNAAAGGIGERSESEIEGGHCVYSFNHMVEY